jgi:hypothetical protein
MDPLSEVLSLLKPRSYISGGFGVDGDLAVQFPKHPGIKCYALLRGECWLRVEGVRDAVPNGVWHDRHSSHGTQGQHSE